MNSDTIFAKIIRGEIPSTKVYEDEQSLAILDINPTNIGHVLVLPKEAFANLYELPDELAGHLFVIAKKIAVAMKQGLRADGVNIIMNNDSAAHQLIFHAHIHVIPRYVDDGLESWHARFSYKEGQAEETAKKIISAL
ncbi:MAG TPA: HIT family protein [Candidatus Paceibacterota bacterium]|nr:HIT family protein [Candidatus Paceibacterota bacterium]